MPADDGIEYEILTIEFESLQAQMKLALDIADFKLVDEIQPKLAAAAAAIRAVQVPRELLN